ncbi:MAG: biotin transporter BioY [Sulfobacillus thermotolerans]|nr:biotin transporter BioY [Sulfobacillus thermotolerans]
MPQSMRFLVLAGFVTAMTAVGALTSFTIPLFSVVPFTLQVLGVYLAGGLLPPRWAFMSMITYVLLGVLGLPVFAEGSHGIGILLGPFGGYLWAYPPAAWLIARLSGPTAQRWRLTLGLLVGILVIYLGGMIGIMVTTGASLTHAVLEGVAPFILWDMMKAAIALPIIARARAFAMERWGADSYQNAS